ncbi:Uncharacterised protein r2_g4261 [Pycnogonum litorale]
MKCHYRKKFLQKLLSAEDIGDIKSDFTLKDCVWSLLAHAWKNVTSDTLTNAWHTLWVASLFEEGDNEHDFEAFPESEADQLVSYANGRISEDNVNEWIDCDKDLPVVNHLTDEETISMVTGTGDESEESDEDVDQPSAHSQK